MICLTANAWLNSWLRSAGNSTRPAFPGSRRKPGRAYSRSGTPADVMAKLNVNIARIVRTPEVKTLLAARRVEAVGSSPEQFAERLRSDVAKWKKLVAERGIKLN